MINKYEILENDTIELSNGKILHRIKALRDFDGVKNGDLGGYIEKEENLSHFGNCWVYNDACVYENAKICDNAIVCGHAVVSGSAIITDSAKILDFARVFDDAQVFHRCVIKDHATICGKSEITYDLVLSGNGFVKDVIFDLT